MSVPTIQPWKRLYGDVKTNLPAVTDAVFENFLWQVTEDFLEMTNIWTEEATINAQPDVNTYSFTVTKGAPYRLLMLYDPKMAGPDKKWVQSNVEMNVPGTITIGYAPSEATTWKAIVAKTLAEREGEQTGVPPTYPDMGDGEWIADKYRGVLTDGVMGLLLLSPAKPYTNVKMGGMRWQWYISGRSRARADALKANVYGGQRWTYPQSFATTNRKGWV
jgi:hypothetical protein